MSLKLKPVLLINCIIISSIPFFCTWILTLTRLLRRKLRMWCFFDISMVKESSFFLIEPHWPPLDFWCSSFGKYQFKPFKLSFFSGFLYQDQFRVRWFYSLFERMRSFYKKSYLFLRISYESALIRNFLRNGRVRG